MQIGYARRAAADVVGSANLNIGELGGIVRTHSTNSEVGMSNPAFPCPGAYFRLYHCSTD